MDSVWQSQTCKLHSIQSLKWKCPTRVGFFSLLLNRMGFSRAQRRRWCLYDDNKSRIIIFTSLFRLTFIQLFFLLLLVSHRCIHRQKKMELFPLSFLVMFQSELFTLLIVCLHTRVRTRKIHMESTLLRDKWEELFTENVLKCVYGGVSIWDATRGGIQPFITFCNMFFSSSPA